MSDGDSVFCEEGRLSSRHSCGAIRQVDAVCGEASPDKTKDANRQGGKAAAVRGEKEARNLKKQAVEKSAC